MTILYTVYSNTTGRVDFIGSASIQADAESSVADGMKIMLNTQLDASTEYVANSERTARPQASLEKTTITADGTDTTTLSNLPDPCTVRVNGVAHEVTGGQLEITASKPATYEIEVRDDPANGETAFPLQAFKATVEAT